ncbi:hypothetical protein [uncultured Pseudoteredinibacter sp.]|uniref:hypothetical protein n=1 Tax=uncultured Pseudoteredinibacter sp. TaxID=1641701 RepID=UPI00260E5FAD|nr:hypothetical protein [uncultured Pseudoteredinibacter sp.]
MEFMGKFKRHLIPAAIVFIPFFYVVVFNPLSLVVTSDGELDGYVNEVRSKAQGKRFWLKQKQIAQDNINSIINYDVPCAAVIVQANSSRQNKLLEQRDRRCDLRKTQYLEKSQPELERLQAVIRVIDRKLGN